MSRMLGVIVAAGVLVARLSVVVADGGAERGVAGLMAQSMPTGSVVQNNAVVQSQTAANTPTTANILNALAAVNQATAPNPTTGVPANLTWGQILNALAQAQAQSAAQQAQPKIGFSPLYGPGPAFQPFVNNQQMNVQTVPPMGSPY